MTDLEFRQHQAERWREINWLAMDELTGKHCDDCGEHYALHYSGFRCDRPEAKPAPATFTTPIPGGTYCENCGRLRHAHIDDHCVSKPLRSRAKRDDESVVAQRDALAAALRDVLRLCVDDRQHMFHEPQQALNHARALLVEQERSK